MKKYFLDDLQALKMVINTSSFSNLAENFDKAAKILVESLKKGNKILICGNGGSASDAEHMAGEIVGRFGYDRPSLPCISLCTPSATFTAISNDYGYENDEPHIFTGPSFSGIRREISFIIDLYSQNGKSRECLTGGKGC